MALSTLSLALALVAGPKQEGFADKPYTVDTSKSTATVKAGKDGTLSLHIKPAKGYKISREAPLKIKLSSAEGVKLSKAKLGQKDAHDSKSTSPQFAVEFKAVSKGEQTIAADATFFVCNKEICQRKKEKVTVAVAVQ